MQERNAREAREEQEAARLKKAEADRAAAFALKKLAEPEADVVEKRRLEENMRRQEPLLELNVCS